MPALMAALAALLLMASGVVWLAVRLLHSRPSDPHQDPMSGFLSDFNVVEREYAAAHGKPLTNPDARAVFERASLLARGGQYRTATDLLETASKTVAVPAIFNDLGVLYAEMGDRARTLSAFREALARNPNYEPVHRNLVRLKSITEDEARPLTREVEPNATNATANVIAANSQVEAEIAADLNDVDTFKFSAPPPPRDILVLDITPRSKNLILGWTLFDDLGNPVERVGPDRKAGAPVHYSFAPPPGTSFFLTVWGAEMSAGSYVINLKALKAFDAYEPNDDVFHATPLNLGQTIEANIMDGQDQDFYSFLSDRTGTADVVLENRSPTLVPGLTAIGPDKRTIGFAPDAKGPGASLQYSFPVEATLTYSIQVWPVLERATGEYSLRVTIR